MPDADYDAAAAVLDDLANQVELAASEREAVPADVARQAGIPVASVLALHDGRDIALKSAAALLRWLTRPTSPAAGGESLG